MPVSLVTDAFRDEAARLSAALAGQPAAAFARPSPCPPWTVADLLWHVSTAAGRVSGMLAAPEPAAGPGEDLTDAVGYYRPDRRFSAEVNAGRVSAARDGAAGRSPADLLAGLDRAWRGAWADAAAAPPGRRVRTRHGDLMLAEEFMRTRVLELAVHGLDLAAGLDCPPWLTVPAAGVVAGLLLPAGPAGGAQGSAGASTADSTAAALRERLSWDRATLVAKLTGRAALTPAEEAVVAGQGIRRLALG
jgi:uncharacterized protein (TIGR03083 family)